MCRGVKINFLLHLKAVCLFCVGVFVWCCFFPSVVIYYKKHSVLFRYGQSVFLFLLFSECYLTVSLCADVSLSWFIINM